MRLTQAALATPTDEPSAALFPLIALAGLQTCSTLLCLALAVGMSTLSAADNPVAQHWNVLEAGAKGDAQMDCTPVFQRLLDEAGKAGGGVVEVPAGRLIPMGARMR